MDIVTLAVALKKSKNYTNEQIQAWITSGSTNKGSWDASTNTPTITQGTGTGGDFYIVSVEGTWDGVEYKKGDANLFDITKNKWVRIAIGPESGEISAASVQFTKDLETNYTIGKYKGTIASPVTIPVNGKSIQDAWDMIFVEDAVPTITQPSVSGDITISKEYEVGTNITPSYSFTFNPGNYQYGPTPTGVTVSEWLVNHGSESSTSPTGSFAAFVVADGTNYSITATANHSQGSIPKTSRGTDYPSGRIMAGTKTKTSSSITGYRKIFWGYSMVESNPTSADIRALVNSKKNAALIDEYLAEDKTKKSIIVAWPAGTRSNFKAVSPMASYADVTSEFIESTVNVEGANGYTAISYTVRTFSPAVMESDYQISAN